jgi:uncharacterized protein YggE
MVLDDKDNILLQLEHYMGGGMKTNKVLSGLVITVAVAAIIYYFPWKNVEWGKIVTETQNTVTVSGEAQGQQQNQIAQFNAGVTATNIKKETAVGEVNQKVAELIASIKQFGIPEADVKTQNLNVYQIPKGYGTPNGGSWQVDNSITITLRDITRASALTDLLTSSGATNVNGPNFMTDDTQKTEVGLVDKAIQNARTKAVAIAKASGRTIGKVVQVTEGTSNGGPILYNAKGTGGAPAPVEPGSQSVTQTVTVVFELK